MREKKPWTHDESIVEAVTNYNALSEARSYEARMAACRDIAGENRELLRRLSLPEGAKVLELGTGTGLFARMAAKSGLQVTALDVSPVMLTVAREKAAAEGLADKITFVEAGFLGHDAPDGFYDAAVSSLTLHHLTDAWKAVAIANVHRMLKPGACFLLVDVVYDCRGGDLDDYLERAIDPKMPDEMRSRFYGHIAKECSTFRWIMEGILQREGFAVEKTEKFGMMPHLFTCRRV